LLRCARWAAIALATICAAPAAALPLTGASGSGAATWEEHSASARDGFGMGAYPLPPKAGPEGLEGERDGTAKERWLRRHFQWLRVLHNVAAAAVWDGRQAGAVQPPSASAIESEDRIRIGDMIVLHPAAGDDGTPPHLLDDGALTEDPEVALGGGEAFEYVVRHRLPVEAAQLVSQFFAPLRGGIRALVADLAATGGQARPQAAPPPPLELAPLGQPAFAGEQAGGGSSRGRAQREPVTMLGFFVKIAMDVVSAPTTYLIALLAFLAWLVMRATVFSRF
jgi:hypothetical protein